MTNLNNHIRTVHKTEIELGRQILISNRTKKDIVTSEAKKVTSEAKKSMNRDVRKIDYSKIVDSDSEEEDVGNKIKRMKLFSSNCTII